MFDPKKFEYNPGGTSYYDGYRATNYQIRQYKKYLRQVEPSSRLNRQDRINLVKNRYGSYFSSSSKLVQRQGHLQGWAKPMSATGGKNANYNWNKGWGTRVDQGKFSESSGSTNILNGSAQWIKQINMSIHLLQINAEYFRIVAGKRALKVFQNSFKFRKFYSNGSANWASLSSYTLKKRARRGTGNRILKEYGDLERSIKLDENAAPMTTRIYTDVVPANSSHHKNHSICYAGYHNEGKGTYGRGFMGRTPKHYIKRQFIGHSTHLNPLTDKFLRKMMKLYLFDSVFPVRKA